MKNDADIEQFILTEIVHNEEFARTVLPYVKDEYFSSEEYKIVFSEVKRHFDSYNTLPSKKALAIDVGNRSSLIEKQYDKVSELVDVMYAEDYKQSTDLRWAVERAEEWCKHKAIYNAIVESANIIDPNNKDKKKKPFTAIEGIVREALSVTFDNSVGHDYYENAEDRYDFYHTKTKRVPFGMDVFNDITNGGLPNKTLNIILAGVHVGKSMFMCDYAANCVRQGRRVLYITCEMAEERIAERIDANLLDVPVDDVSLLQKKIFGERISRLKTSFGTNGILKIKEYPTGSASVSHFRALLSELEVKQNFTPEVIIIDYLNICASMRFTGDQSNSYGYMKAVSEELRGLAIEHDVPILTACQLNRSGSVDADFGMESIAESFGINATADMIFGLISTEVLEKNGLLCVKQLKNRHKDPAYNKRFAICVNKPKMKFSEADAAAQALLSTGAAGVAALGSGTSSMGTTGPTPVFPSKSKRHGTGGGYSSHSPGLKI